MRESTRFLSRTDWLSFGLATGVVLLVYVWTLAPSVTLGFSGIFATGALYAGVPHPPGYPVWTLYAWLFANLVPFSNVAWRVALSSAVAGALSCGLIALMVSRGGTAIIEQFTSGAQLSPKQKRGLRVVAGFAAGASFGFNGGMWGRSVVADVWPFTIFLFTCVIALLMRWMHQPERRRYFYCVVFVYGVLLTNSQILLCVAPALPLVVALRDPALGRDMLAACVGIFIAGLIANASGTLPMLTHPSPGLFRIYLIVGFSMMAVAAALAFKTSRVFTEWKTILTSGGLFLVGTCFYFYVPIASMTNPPMNWGYARTVSGFQHTITRGQYERIQPPRGVGQWMDQLRLYSAVTAKEYGWVYLLLAMLTICTMRKLSREDRDWILGLLILFISLITLMMTVLNLENTRDGRAMAEVFFSASYVILATWAGYGMLIFATFVGKG